ncbi:hypothetical protein [Pedobacter paludis]|uniref:Uncharacterized protein n=1 Tax=Pedobacter paludis TaxID=2203212 RepID=A0A317F2V3_9SPHI|nr:hypothetical protein [Pedobacter paludis]PWS33165.1 hypothetical protein DF947_00570 [Pedobacter paludis]
MKKLKFKPKHGFFVALATGMLVVNSCKKEVVPPVAKNMELVLKDKLMGTVPLSGSLTNNDMQIIQELEYLNKKADADHSYNPCHGTARLGNIRFQGTMEHWIIQFAYVMQNGATHKREYYIPESSSNIWNPRGPGYADLVDEGTKEIFEIKSQTIGNYTGFGMSNYAREQAIAEINKYVASAKKFCGGGWKHGENFTRMSFMFCSLIPTL